ncbi:hypothetical protein POM88_008640 [Heracleum sosnowskyi]|uniref:Uncharacterized protein n=1 Tax=Heracleum sosnowskyi TaxID=360622 RepID=A0AAD8N7G8_9APIA|nr:hypothetical protein POM88_008640 [Heracleum sosnowskyi]
MEGMELNQALVRTLKTGYMEIKKEYEEVPDIVPWNLSVLPSELQARIFDIVLLRKEKMEFAINDIQELEKISLGEKDCGLNQTLGKLFEEMQRPCQIMGFRTLDSDFLSTDNSLSLYLDVLNAMVNLPVSIADYLIVDKNVKDLLSFDWEKAKQVMKTCPANTNKKVRFSSEIAEPAVWDVQTNSLKEPPDKKKLNKPTNMWFKLKEAIHTCVIKLLKDVTYDDLIRVFLRCSKIKDNHQTKKNYEEICVNKGTRSRKWNCCDSYLEDSLVHLVLQNLNESPQMLSGKDYMFVTLAKFEQRRENIVLKQVDRGKVMKIEKVEHKMLVWDGPQNSKTSAAVNMVHHFIFFPAEMRVDKDIHVESLTNGT